jgi:hypothetical protein
MVRLVYADWLEEQGNPHGEFIRVQCRLARLVANDPNRAALEMRERQLLERFQDEWLGRLRQWALRWTFRRGFLETLTVPVQAHLDRSGELVGAGPRFSLAVDLVDVVIPQNILNLIPPSVAREIQVLPLGWRQRRLVVATRDPYDKEDIAKLSFILNRQIEPVGASVVELMEAIEKCYPNTGADDELLVFAGFIDTGGFPHDSAALGDDGSPVVRLIDLMLHEAVRMRATEIRIKSLPDRIRVDYRVNGHWQERDSLPLRLLPLIVARLRFLAGIEPDLEWNGQQYLIPRTPAWNIPQVWAHIQATPEGPRILIRL